jgi:small subunit ribosomal protein S20
MRQDIKRRARNHPLKSAVKTLLRNELKLIKEGKLEEVKKSLPHVYSVIDTACKKHLLHKNTAARKKSRLALAFAALEKGVVKAVAGIAAGESK